MKRSVFIALIVALPLCTLTLAQTNTLPEGLGNEFRTPDGLRALIEQKDPRFVLIDIRPPAEYAAGHIPTAINIPDGVTAGMEAPPSKDKYLILYCLGGMRSPAAGEKMLADGYKYVLVWGGITNWPYDRESSVK